MARAELSRPAIVDRALDVADAEGLEAVTIRRLATELGVTPMALYWHVKNKDELLDAMGDALFESIDVAAYDTADGAGWTDDLAATVRALVDAFRRHPTCTDLAFRRVLACDAGRRLSEHVLGVLRSAGFSPRQTADIATHALQTAIMLVSGEPGAEPGTTAEEASARLAQKRAALHALPAERYPFIREMAEDLLQCDDMAGYYDFGIALFVSGARATLAERVPAQSRA
jgi:TetR/AcrR family tetracycline transcriptional repressor